MATIANRLRKLLTVDFVEGLKTRRRDALTVWQDSVKLAAAGQEVDVAAIDEAAVALRINDVPGSFESDVLAYQAHQEAVRNYDRLKLEVASGAAEFVRNGERVHELDAERMRLLAEMRAHEGTSVSAAYAERDVVQAQQRSPRMFARELAEGARLPNQAAPSVEEVHAVAVAASSKPRVPLGEAEWVSDDDGGL